MRNEPNATHLLAMIQRWDVAHLPGRQCWLRAPCHARWDRRYNRL